MVQSCDCTITPNKGQGLTHVRQLPYQYGISSVRQLHGENEVFGPVLVSHLFITDIVGFGVATVCILSGVTQYNHGNNCA